MNCSMKRQYKERVRHEFNNAKRVIQPHVGEEEKPNPNNFDYYYQKFNFILSQRISNEQCVFPRPNGRFKGTIRALKAPLSFWSLSECFYSHFDSFECFFLIATKSHSIILV